MRFSGSLIFHSLAQASGLLVVTAWADGNAAPSSAPVPEPETFILMGAGLITAALVLRLFRR